MKPDPARRPLPSGLVAFVKRDCPTCVLVAPVLAALARGEALLVISQDDPEFPPGTTIVDDRSLELSWHHGIEAVPTLLRVADGEVRERAIGWHRGEWEALTGVRGLGPDLPAQRVGCGSLSVDPDRQADLAMRFGRSTRASPDTLALRPNGHPAPLPIDRRDDYIQRSMANDDEEDFAALFAASEKQDKARPKVRAGDRVRGRVVAVGAQSAFVAIGSKAEAVIDLAEFRDPATGDPVVAVGDQIEATVTDDGARSGSIVLKRTLGRGGHVPGEIEQALEHGIGVEGVVTGQNKGGFDVQVLGQRAFCPAGQIDVRRNDPASYVGQRLRFRVTKVESGGRNIVVSRRQLLEEESAAAASETWTRLAVGSVVTGTVTSIRDFGAFVDIGGVDGMIHVSELGYGRPGHPSEVLTVGQTVEAQVLKLEPESEGGRGRISLSIRALAPDPWQTIAERFPVGSTVPGKVKRLEPFGAFVEIGPGIEGLVHVSRITLDRRISHPRQALASDAEVEVTVVTIDAEKRRIGLSMVESARRAKEGLELAESRETAEIMAKSQGGRSLGTFADLLSARSKSKPRG